MKRYDSYQIRQGEQLLSVQEAKLMEILMEFGVSIDPEGYDGGDYDTAMIKLRLLLLENQQ